MTLLIDAVALKANLFDYAPPEMTWDRGDIEHKINDFRQAIGADGMYYWMSFGFGAVVAICGAIKEAR